MKWTKVLRLRSTISDRWEYNASKFKVVVSGHPTPMDFPEATEGLSMKVLVSGSRDCSTPPVRGQDVWSRNAR
jgi:hypothetical protein